MNLMDMIKMIPVPVLVAVVIALVVITAVIAFQYAKMKNLNGIREDVYQLFLKAEHVFKSEEGRAKLQYVVKEARKMLPNWLQFFISEETLTTIIDAWFKGVKDLLDDGRVNGSAE